MSSYRCRFTYPIKFSLKKRVITFSLAISVMTFLVSCSLSSMNKNDGSLQTKPAPAFIPTIEIQTPDIQVAASPSPMTIQTKETTSNSTPTQTPTKGITKIEPTVSNQKFLPNLFPGLFILYYSLEVQSDRMNLSGISMNGHDIHMITELESNSIFPKLSPDSKHIAYIQNIDSRASEIYIKDYDTNDVTSVPNATSCFGLDWSPDSTRLAAACDKLYIYKLDDESIITLSLNDTVHMGFDAVAWSPDGTTIAVHRFYDNMWNRDIGGELYLIDAVCLSNYKVCEQETNLYNKVRSRFLSPSWSPDSHSLAAFINQGEIGIWNIKNNSFVKLILPNWQNASILPEWGYLGWSPDGEWFAYSQADSVLPDEPTSFDLYTIPINGGTPKLVLDNDEVNLVMGWLSVPWPFRMGQTYTVTSSGTNLNLRENPSLDGKIIRRLHQGEIITIVDGPVPMDGYNWWKIRTKNEVEGWVVDIPNWYATEISP